MNEKEFKELQERVYRLEAKVRATRGLAGLNVYPGIINLGQSAKVAGDLEVTGTINGTVTQAQNADTVDSQHASAFATAGHTHTTISNDLTISGNILGSEAIGARAYRNTTQAINPSTPTAITFNTEVFDTDNIWAIGSPTRFTAARNGYYLAGANIGMPSGTATPFRITLAVRRDGTINYAVQHILTGMDTVFYLNVNTIVYLNSGNYVEFLVNHTNGSALNISGAGANTQEFASGWLYRIP